MKTLSILRVLPLIITIFLAGCSSAGKKDAETSAANAGVRELRSDVQKAQPQGSLEDLQRGAPPVTPNESPLKEIYFDFDSHALRADARETLKADAEWLKQNPGVRVTVEGHCDERGTTQYNLALGAKRAQAAKDYLVTLGVASDRISTTSFGREALVCREHNEDCWQRNRRDRFALAAKPGV